MEVSAGFRPATQVTFRTNSLESIHHSSQAYKSGAQAIAVATSSRSLNIRSSHLKYKQPFFLGDWVLLVSLYNKLTRLKMMNWLCCELLEKNYARSNVLSWLIYHSPLLVLFEPSLGMTYLAEDFVKTRSR